MTGSKFTLERGWTITEQDPSRSKENLEASKLTWEPESSSKSPTIPVPVMKSSPAPLMGVV